MWSHCLSALSFLIAVLLANFVTPAALWDEMWVKHTWDVVPADWESLGDPAAGAMFDLHISLKHNRERALIDALSEISDPMHSRYSAYLSKDQVAELVSPHPDTVELVRAWLVHHDIPSSSVSVTLGGSWLTATNVLVSQANQLLGASYQIYWNCKTNHTIIRTVGYALPTVLHTHIRTVAPTTHFPSVRGKHQISRRSSLGAAPVQAQGASGKLLTTRELPGISPSFLRWLYNTGAYSPAAHDRNTLGILGIDNEYPNKDDLTSFMTRYESGAEDATFTVEQWNGGGYNPNTPGDGASLGTQYAAAMTYPTNLVFYSVGGNTEWAPGGRPLPGDIYLEFLKKLLADPSPPQTISITYGQIERELPLDYAEALCLLFAELGSRGVSVLVASGRDGVGEGNCVNAQGFVKFVPEFPSSCPWVTSVGGTTRARPEIAANLSGGGFSFYFEREPYQRRVVNKYLREYPDEGGYYNRLGRGYPDISAQALNYKFVMKDQIMLMDGTTCSVSTAASIISLMNDFLVFHKKPPLGLLNPWLYFRGLRGFNDIRFGCNPGCNTDGFAADIGWDPVTGLGSIDLEKMLKILKKQLEESDSDSD